MLRRPVCLDVRDQHLKQVSAARRADTRRGTCYCNLPQPDTHNSCIVITVADDNRSFYRFACTPRLTRFRNLHALSPLKLQLTT